MTHNTWKQKTAAANLRRDFPWWLVAIGVMIGWTTLSVLTSPNYREAFDFIIIGLRETIVTSLVSYGIALIIGLLAALGQLSSSVFLRNLTKTYVELVRGIPMLVLIFFIALVAVPGIIEGINALGGWFAGIGAAGLGQALQGINNQGLTMSVRAIFALSITYGAFLSEIFRAGIQSIGKGQMEAGRSLGLSYVQTMRYVILPQAVRNVLPALGNDFIAMVKDSSLVSVLAVRDITQVARLYAGRTFRFREAYVTLSILYLTMTVALSLLMQRLEKSMRGRE